MRMTRYAAVVLIVAAMAVLGSGMWYVMHTPASLSGDPERITVGKMPIEAHTLIYVAEDRGFFAEGSLAVTIVDYPTGPAAIDALMNGDVDISGAGEYAVVEQALQKQNISIIASIDKYQFFNIAGRKDRGIESISDLAGKRIGLAQGPAAECFLGRSLNLNGISIQNVTLVDLPHSRCVDAIANGSVDALVFIGPYAGEIAERLGENGAVWPAQNDQMLYSVMVCRNGWAASPPETITKFLASLARAEDYLIAHPAEAQAIVRQQLNYTDAYTERVWSNNQFSVTLDQSLITAMEDEARWMIRKNLTNATEIPDFREYIYTQGLESVNPGAMRIIR